MTDEQGNFLSRWSRRKLEARRAEEEALPAVPPEPGLPAVPPAAKSDPTASSAPNTPLPPIEELRGVESEFPDFLLPGVDEAMRRTALKKLFQDPHFNIMDGLDTYIDDYTQADPIPEAMLRSLNQAQGLIFDRKEAPGGEQPAEADAADRSPQAADEVRNEARNRSLPEATRKEDGNDSQHDSDTDPDPDPDSTTP